MKAMQLRIAILLAVHLNATTTKNPDAVFLYPGPCEKTSVSNVLSVCKKKE